MCMVCCRFHWLICVCVIMVVYLNVSFAILSQINCSSLSEPISFVFSSIILIDKSLLWILKLEKELTIIENSAYFLVFCYPFLLFLFYFIYSWFVFWSLLLSNRILHTSVQRLCFIINFKKRYFSHTLFLFYSLTELSLL